MLVKVPMTNQSQLSALRGHLGSEVTWGRPVLLDPETWLYLPVSSKSKHKRARVVPEGTVVLLGRRVLAFFVTVIRHLKEIT